MEMGKVLLEKFDFVEDYLEPLVNRVINDNQKYHVYYNVCNEKEEIVIYIGESNNPWRKINVTGDSLLAIVRDVVSKID